MLTPVCVWYNTKNWNNYCLLFIFQNGQNLTKDCPVKNTYLILAYSTLNNHLGRMGHTLLHKFIVKYCRKQFNNNVLFLRLPYRQSTKVYQFIFTCLLHYAPRTVSVHLITAVKGNCSLTKTQSSAKRMYLTFNP